MDINVTMIGQIITFAILVIFTMKFVWPPLNKMLDERSAKIAEGLSAAEKGKQELLSAQAKISQELQEVQRRSSEILDNAKKRSDQMIHDATVAAQLERTRILKEAKAQIDQEIIKVREELRSQIAVLALQGARQILKDEIDEKRHQKILSDLIVEL